MAKVYRVVVRGQFADLDDDVRTALLAEAAEHDLFRSAFTPDGTFTYDDRLISFNLRYEVRLADDHEHADPAAAVATGCVERAASWLTAVGIGHKHLRATASDMADAWR
ncbi:MAG TPA: DUF6204 family protein [Aquihabitans sp.]|jgi:hypothetical protein|nr:DUF6204 family protein [Aquihabitans sp.]